MATPRKRAARKPNGAPARDLAAEQRRSEKRKLSRVLREHHELQKLMSRVQRETYKSEAAARQLHAWLTSRYPSPTRVPSAE